ncbi:MAG: hypothetical protein WAR79_08315 [Melioribacteraceae bacterium]
MKKIFILIELLFTKNLIAQFWIGDPLEPIYSDSNNLSNYSLKWGADFPFGTIAGVHIIFKLTQIEETITEITKINSVKCVL